MHKREPRNARTWLMSGEHCIIRALRHGDQTLLLAIDDVHPSWVVHGTGEAPHPILNTFTLLVCIDRDIAQSDLPVDEAFFLSETVLGSNHLQVVPGSDLDPTPNNNEK